MKRAKIIFLILATFISGCKVIQVEVPSDVFTLLDEVVAIRAQGPNGKKLENVNIPLENLQKKINYKFDEVKLLHYSKKGFEKIEHQRKGDFIVADLIGGETYTIRAVIPQLVDTYKILCMFVNLRPKVNTIPDFWERFCPVVFCSFDTRPATNLYGQIPQLEQYRNDLSLEGLKTGGFGNLDPTGSICERCEKFGKGGVFVDDDCKGSDCLDLSFSKVVDSDSPKINDHVKFTIKVAEVAHCGAEQVVVIDILPSGLTYVSDNSNGSYDANTGIWTIGYLQANSVVSLEIIAQVNQTGNFRNRAELSGKSIGGLNSYRSDAEVSLSVTQ